MFRLAIRWREKGWDKVISHAIFGVKPGLFGWVAAVLLGWSAGSLGTADASEAGPVAPLEALKGFVLEPGLKVTLAASEPQIASPVALAFDEWGRMMVVENRGYPTGPSSGQPPMGVVAMLEDRDRDSFFEKRTVFVDGLGFPNGILRWRNGWIVTCAPDVLFLADTDGDGRADVKRVLLTGFATNGSTQLRVSHPTPGPDGWIYLTSGLTGGKVYSPAHPERAPVETRQDVRFHPDTLEVQTSDGGGQFGQSFDDWGNRFTCFNRVQVQHVVLPSQILRRNPEAGLNETLQNCPELVPNKAMRYESGAARIFPISQNVTTADSHAGFFTAACGVFVYRGGVLPERFDGAVFSCDPTGNLVHQDFLTPVGGSFSAKPGRSGAEFMASRDLWFRPVFLTSGPDGSLYVADMYRRTIEHPDYLPEEIRKRTDFESGRNLGRIWRIVPEKWNFKSSVSRPGFWDKAGTKQLVEKLDSPVGWERETAWRRLIQERGLSSELEIENSLVGPVSARGYLARLQALLVFGRLDETRMVQALRHPDSRVRSAVARIAALRFAGAPGLRRMLSDLASDPDAAVRFQAVVALGSYPDSEVIPILATAGMRDSADPWMRAAVLSGSRGRELEVWKGLMSGPERSDAASIGFIQTHGRILGARSNAWEVFETALGFVGEAQHSGRVMAALAGLAEGGLAGGGREMGPLGVWAGRLGVEGSRKWQDLLKQALVIVQDENLDSVLRQAAMSVLGQTSTKEGERLLAVFDRSPSPDARLALVRAISQPHLLGVAKELLSAERWQSASPAVRSAVLTAFTGRPEYAMALMEAVERGSFAPAGVDNIRRQQLLRHRDSTIKERAARLFQGLGGGGRKQAFETAKESLKLKPVASNGRLLFQKFCTSCHRLNREGHAVGPDLFDVRNQPKESLLYHLLIPEAEIAPNFTQYVCETKDGRTVTGILVSDGAGGVTLRQAQGIEEVIPRGSVQRIYASELSMMPQEFEKSMTVQELADLLSYLKGEGE